MKKILLAIVAIFSLCNVLKADEPNYTINYIVSSSAYCPEQGQYVAGAAGDRIAAVHFYDDHIEVEYNMSYTDYAEYSHTMSNGTKVYVCDTGFGNKLYYHVKSNLDMYYETYTYSPYGNFTLRYSMRRG